MKLTGKVIKIESGSQYVDKRQRIVIKVGEAGNAFRSLLEVPNEPEPFSLKLDDEVEIFAFLPKTKADLTTVVAKEEF